MKNKTIDLNDLLKGANLLVAGLIAFTYVQKHGNEFVDDNTIILAFVLCIQTHLALLFERRRRDPFVILLAFDMIFFFAFRIVTLNLFSFSVVFDRYSFGAADSNYALLFILAANTIIYAGLYSVGSRSIPKMDSVGWKARSPVRVLCLMMAAIIFAYFSGSYWNEDTIPRVLGFLVIFLAPNITLLMALSYYLLFRKTLSRKFAIALAAVIAGDAIIHTLLGSRGAVIVIVQNVMIASLSIMGCISLRRKYVLGGIVAFPVVAALLIVSFTISTYNRSAKEEGRPLELSRALELARDSSSELSIGTDLDLILAPIAGRAGYFDFSAEIIAHREEYAGVLNLTSYAKSIVDNVLTPGFDVYDQPKASNALKFVYQGLGTPSKERVSADTYQSDQLGIYGEFYGLFGYGCLPVLFAIAFLFKYVYLRLKGANPFALALKRAIVLSVFVWTIDSYGVDWTILEGLPLGVAMVIYARFFAVSRVRPTEQPSVARSGPSGPGLLGGS